VVLQIAELVQKHTGAVVERTADRGQRYPVAAAVEQGQTELHFQILYGGEDRGLRTPELFGGGLKTALYDDCVEALQLVQGNALNHRMILLRISKFNSFYQISYHS
jgi:hypothetical protein